MSELRKEAEEKVVERFKQAQICDLQHLIQNKQKEEGRIKLIEIQMEQVEKATTLIELDSIRAGKCLLSINQMP